MRLHALVVPTLVLGLLLFEEKTMMHFVHLQVISLASAHLAIMDGVFKETVIVSCIPLNLYHKICLTSKDK